MNNEIKTKCVWHRGQMAVVCSNTHTGDVIEILRIVCCFAIEKDPFTLMEIGR